MTPVYRRSLLNLQYQITEYSFPLRLDIKMGTISMRILFTTLLTIMTLIGGHFVNRRFDRIVMFLGLALLILSAWWVTYTILLTNAFQSGSVNEQLLNDFPARWFYVTGLAIWLASIVTTIFDGVRQRPELQQKTTASGVIGAVSLSLTAVCIMGYYVWMSQKMLMEFNAAGGDTTSYQSSWSQPDNYFSQYIYFDWIRDSEKDRIPPPAGSGKIVGKFTYLGEPARGVKLTVLLAGGYETETLTTNDEGLFTIPVTPGPWTVQLIKVNEWEEKPAGKSLTIVTGFEPALGKRTYSRSDYSTRGQGLIVHVVDEYAEPAINLDIRENAVLRWPAGDKGALSATLDADNIEWEAYPGASQYQVHISTVERRDNGVTYSPIVARNVMEATQYSLVNLPSIDDEKEEHEYSVSVFVFDENGAFLSESDRWSQNSVFKIANNTKLVPDDIVDILSTGSLPDKEEMLKVFDNRKRLSAVEVLIENGLLDAGESMLDKIDGPTDPGKLEALRGYLHAERNQCEEANRWFDKAVASGGKTCISSRYRSGCS